MRGTPPRTAMLTTSLNRRFQYTPLPPDAADYRNVRLLELLPDGDPSAIIRCKLRVASLYQEPSYEALSYCWGDPSLKAPILCNGAWLEITTSLHAALRRLRDATKSRMLWADAICINQGPEALEERSQQVQMMRHIYQNAKRVIVWLGNSQDDSHLAIDLIRRLIKAKPKLDEFGPLPYFDDEHLRAAGLPNGLSNKSWLSLRPFFQRAWFRRIWVVQEVAVATSVTVACGVDDIAWEDLISGVEVGVSSGVLGDKRAVDADTLDFLGLANAARLAFRKSPVLFQKYPAHNFGGLLNYLLWFRRRCATDHRDKAFALYGLSSSLDDEMQLIADYSTNVKEAYCKITTAILKASQNLDVLSVPRGDTDVRRQLPSWVADWSDSSNQTMSLVGQTRHRYAASKDSRTSPKFTGDQLTLILAGEVIDTISQLAPTLQHENSVAAPLYGWATALEQFSTNLENISQNQHVLAEWKRLALGNESIQYVTGEPNAIVFEQTIVASLPPSQNMKANYQDWRKNEPPRKFLQRLSFDSHPWLFKTAVMVQLGLDALAASKPRERQYATMAYGRRLARTAKGYLALVPSQTQIGDSIVLCKGGQTPLVLRPKSKLTAVWELIGDSYVHGVMSGQAFDEERCRDLRIV